MSENDSPLGDLRKRIDAVDDEILRLLNRRAELVMEVARVKKGEKLGFHVPNREREILERLAAQNTGPFPADAVRTVFREIISASVGLQAPMRVAFLGPKATFTHLAAMQQFGMSAELVPESSIGVIFDDVEKGRTQYGVVPVENSTEGVVTHTLDTFVESDLKIGAEILLPISHDLLSRTGSLAGIQKVYSHPQALGQCRKWLTANLPGVPLVDVGSTALAAQIAGGDPNAAAIASEFAGSLYDLKVVQDRIEDQAHNVTRFLVIGRDLTERSGNDRTSILFSVKDEPGVLFRMLEPFAKRGINLSKIESRPGKTKAWEYVFFVDLFGHVSDPDVAEAIEELKTCCRFVKVLGSYPRAR
jgi:chorismate mutase/prephenate dehydratase